MVNHQPEGYSSVNVSIVADGASEAIDFYTGVFGATERMRIDGPDGIVGHAELQFGDSVVMVSDPYPDMGVTAPVAGGAGAYSINLYVTDVDATIAAAEAGGAKVLRAAEDQFYGDRAGQVLCPWGHRWGLATHVEDVSPEEMERRAADM